ncbi:uncharacterized protein FN964_014367 [Alca torda]
MASMMPACPTSLALSRRASVVKPHPILWSFQEDAQEKPAIAFPGANREDQQQEPELTLASGRLPVASGSTDGCLPGRAAQRAQRHRGCPWIPGIRIIKPFTDFQ